MIPCSGLVASCRYKNFVDPLKTCFTPAICLPSKFCEYWILYFYTLKTLFCHQHFFVLNPWKLFCLTPWKKNFFEPHKTLLPLQSFSYPPNTFFIPPKFVLPLENIFLPPVNFCMPPILLLPPKKVYFFTDKNFFLPSKICLTNWKHVYPLKNFLFTHQQLFVYPMKTFLTHKKHFLPCKNFLLTP